MVSSASPTTRRPDAVRDGSWRVRRFTGRKHPRHAPLLRCSWSEQAGSLATRRRHERKHGAPARDRRGVEVPARRRPVRARAAGKGVRAQRLHQDRDAGPAAEVGVHLGARDDRALGAARPDGRRRRGVGHEGLGAREGRDALRARLLPAHRPHRREARQLPRARRQRRSARRVRGQDPRAGRARRVELPQRRPARDVRGPRLHRVGRHQPGVHPREPERQHAVHPDGVRLVDGRRARPQDAAAAFAAGARHAGGADPAPVRARRSPTRSCRSRARSRSTS